MEMGISPESNLVIKILQSRLYHYIHSVHFTAIATLAAAQAIPGCQDQCGSVSIPYPFGIGDGCHFSSDFHITCRNSTPFLGTGNLKITNISIDGELHTLNFMTSQRHNWSGLSAAFSTWFVITTATFRISKSKNKFAVIRCDSYRYLNEDHDDSRGQKWYSTGCISTCYQRNYVDDMDCSSSGCCQMDIPDGLYNVNLTESSFYNHTQTLSFSPCTYSLIVEQSKIKFSSEYLQMPLDTLFPVILDWVIDEDTSNPLCQEHAKSFKLDNVQSYLCRFEDGYRGNLYLQQGCQDINECQDLSLNDCLHQNHCQNTMGSYNCSYPKGYHGYGRKSGQHCDINHYGP